MDNIKYYCVIDFECTCVEERRTDYNHEIIEFPCVVIDADTKETITEFHEYVKPIENCKLSNFCTKLTGITQRQVNDADTLDIVLQNFEKWLIARRLLSDDMIPCFAICTDGPWDMESFLAKECKRKDITFPSYMKSWVDVREYFRRFSSLKRRKNISRMLEELDMTFIGSQHSGIDDARNIARILIYLLDHLKLEQNDFLYNKDKKMRYRGR